ncbi:MAG: hypothetical protein RI841_14225, partial [Halomonas sp.]|uniref:glycosyltransferase n=1 Tax=Halomonas sp. TaxID=1486246 RepID=UPI0028701A85
MAHILAAWELGGALGHLANLRPFVEAALARGHEVTLAVKELRHVPLLFRDHARLRLFQAPYHYRAAQRPYRPLRSFTQLMLQRFETPEELATLHQGWRAILETTRPDLVVADFAPTLHLAARGGPWQQWAVGNGFFVPRTDLPYLGVFPGVRRSEQNARSLAEAESRLLALANLLLARHGQPPLPAAAALYAELDRHWLLTLPELDAFGSRPEAEYLGLPPLAPGEVPPWPEASGPRVFAYLSACPALEPLLQALAEQQAAVVIYCRDLSPEVAERFPNVHLAGAPVDMRQAMQQADLVINMANHATAACAYLAGVPQLLIPRRQEQLFLAQRLAGQGKAVAMAPDSPEPAKALAKALALPP